MNNFHTLHRYTMTTLIWIPLTIMAAFMQSGRNALQKELSTHTTPLAATLARFILAAPMAAIYLFVHIFLTVPEQNIPVFSTQLITNLIFAAATQIFATLLMIMMFQKRNYAIGVGLAKSEAIIAATLGALFFNAPLSIIAWAGVIVGALAIWYMTIGKNSHNTRIETTNLVLGCACGLGFALCTLFIRESSLLIQQQLYTGFALSAAWVLFCVTSIQAIALTLWLSITAPASLLHLYKHKRLTTGISFCGFVASVGWFTAMSIESAGIVKTLGQVEVIFTLLISRYIFKEQLQRYDVLGLGLIALSAIMVMYA